MDENEEPEWMRRWSLRAYLRWLITPDPWPESFWGRCSRSFGCLMVILTGLPAMGTLWGLAGPAWQQIQTRARLMQGCENCRAVVLALKAYAADHQGHYPDAADDHPMTANAAFRHLIEGGYIRDERIFGCPDSPFQPDGKLSRSLPKK